MNTFDITNFPLSWPVTYKRTQHRARSQFGKHSIISSARELEHQLRLMGARNLIISTNLKVRNDGLPYSNQRTPDDPGVAVYFDWRQKPFVFPCDKFRTIEDNLWAICKHLEALRGQERWGVGSLEQAFAGYMALPDPTTRTWWEVLGVQQHAGEADVRVAYRTLVRRYHPDGAEPNVEMFLQVAKAWDDYQDKK